MWTFISNVSNGFVFLLQPRAGNVHLVLFKVSLTAPPAGALLCYTFTI